MKKAAVLWTGGKDSALALFESHSSFQIDCLVTFTPESQCRFYAHPLPLIRAQAESIGLPHHCIPIKKPFDRSYTEAIAALRDDGIETVITGDIAQVNGYPNWVQARAKGILDVHMPLWESARAKLLNRLISHGFEVMCTLAYKHHFTPTIVGERLDTALIDRLLGLSRSTGLDICGENGEYHTSVLNGPLFQYGIQLAVPRIRESAEFHYLDYSHVTTTKSQPLPKQPIGRHPDLHGH